MKKIVTALLMALITAFAVSPFFSLQQTQLLGIVTLLVVMWTNNALPLGVVSLLPILLFPAFGIIDLGSVTPNYAKSIIFLFLGGFMLAIAMQKSNLHVQLSNRLLHLFPHTARGIIYAMAIVSAALSSILSNTTITLMLLPIGLFISNNARLKVRILLAIAYGASIGGILTPIGTPPNLLLLGYLDTIGLQAPTFTGWMAMTAPVVVSMLLLMPWFLSIGLKDEPIGRLVETIEPFTKAQKKLLWILAILSIVLILNTPIKPWYPGLGLNEKGLLLAAGLILFLPGIDLLEWEDSRSIPYEIIFLFGAGFSIAAAFGSTHLAEAIAMKLQFVHMLPLWSMLAVIALVISFSTEITSNTALTSIALPVMAQLYGIQSPETLLILMVTTIAASYAFMLPIATPPNAIVMSSRVIEVKTMATIGFFIDLAGVAIVSVTAYFLWQWVL
ncbi:SLC13 family permease [Hydrogenimonas cancrithermarum]|uniref:Transporter n=1 Tax=Hydrogenimonas cancrithermarum TaxID=2993563 RepID=A0ABM8FLI3_9BACT|nr:SLC13 family permease [Hydrogenimonas cancrithermarum]BDY12267.1 transporter [Hydrogenimonas cancrithermarum]